MNCFYLRYRYSSDAGVVVGCAFIYKVTFRYYLEMR